MLTDDDVKRIYAAIEPDLNMMKSAIFEIGSRTRATQTTLALALHSAT